MPKGTALAPLNPYAHEKSADGKPWPEQDVVRPWDSLNDDEKKLFARMAEVFAGFVSHCDHQIGRLLDYLEEVGDLESTIVVVVSGAVTPGRSHQHGQAKSSSQGRLPTCKA